MIYSILLPEDELISFSSVTEYKKTLSGTVSNYETEFGFPINDNMTLNNPKIDLNVIMSYYILDGREAVLENGKWVVYGEYSQPLSHVELEQSIEKVYLNKTPFTLLRSTSLSDPLGTIVDEITGCLIDRLTFTENSENYGAVFPNMSITQTRQVVVAVEDVPNVVPQLIPKIKVATPEDVAQSKASGKSPSDTDTTDTVKDAAKGDPTMIDKAAQQEKDISALNKQLDVTRNNIDIANAGGSSSDYATINNGRVVFPNQYVGQDGSLTASDDIP